MDAARSINCGIRVASGSACVLCAGPGRLLYAGQRDRCFDAPGVWCVRECALCGLAWTDPRPLESDLGKLYERYYTHGATTGTSGLLMRLQTAVARPILSSAFGYPAGPSGRLLGILLSCVPALREIAGATVRWLHCRPRGRLLDVGCGSGQFLHSMRELGWDISGVEPDPHALRVARDRLGSCVAQGSLDTVSTASDRFEAITLYHVLEHVPDPVRTLQACRRLLSPSGSLVIVTPNLESLGRRCFGDAWRGWEVPRHLFLFSRRSLSAVARRAGLGIRSVRTSAQSALWMWWASSLIRRDGRLPGGTPRGTAWPLLLGGALFHALQEGLNWFSRGVGEEIVLVATKDSVARRGGLRTDPGGSR